jgi:hypothetical protein
MLRFKASESNKRKARRLQRSQRRELVNQLFQTLDISSGDSDDEVSYGEVGDGEVGDGEVETLTENTPLDLTVSKVMNYKNDEFDNIYSVNEEPVDIDNSQLLYDGSGITTKDAVSRLTGFMIDYNVNKQTVISLLRIIKSLLPTPNRLPTTWKAIMKILGHTSTSRSSHLCSICFKHCRKGAYGVKSCENQECVKKKSTLKSNEIVELVHLDIRAQIQTILTRNEVLLNQKDLYPPTDVCFGDYYRSQTNSTSNRVTLIVHTDGAPIVKLSKQSLWPCFASLVELPPPVRDYQKNIVLMSLWISRKKPDANVFLDETIEELKQLINGGTSMFINGLEYQISFQTQYFVSDLPAKALFCKTINFNGYSACTECCSTGM